ncbi:hypothetical protein D3C81_1933180 [compost metagenome]
MIAPELRKHPHKMTPIMAKISGGATMTTHAEKVVPSRTVDAELIIIAIVPGPAVLGMASGTNAILAEGSDSISSDLLLASGDSWALCAGNSMRKPIKATIKPPAIRNPGIDIPKVFITTCPA